MADTLLSQEGDRVGTEVARRVAVRAGAWAKVARHDAAMAVHIVAQIGRRGRRLRERDEEQVCAAR